MNREYVALEGKIFKVELLSHLGSTNYGWCISALPKEVIFMAAENIPVGGRDTTLLQRFYFGVVASGELNVDINFTMNCWSDLNKVAESFTAKVRIVPSNSSDFVSYSENETNAAIPYGFVLTADSTMKYGYPCGAEDANLKYGYPCGLQDANLKYGYPCGVQDANLKYGYPCGVQDANLKYGYPCFEATKDARPYGYPY